MKFEVRRRACFPGRYASLFVLSVTLAACAGAGAWDSSYMYQSKRGYVRLVPIESKAPPNSHPFTISADQLQRLLARIRVSGTSSTGMVPVFSKNELKTIVPPLAVGLSRAGPGQDVTFAVYGYRGLLGKYSPESFTTGRLFVRADSLNLIFGRIQQRVDSGELDNSGYTPAVTAGTRSRRIGATVWKIDPGGAHFHEQRGDWLVFERSTIPAAAPVPAARPASGPGAKPAEPAPAASTPDRKAQEIENRLRVLDELKQKGVITEQEYRERRREILQEL